MISNTHQRIVDKQTPKSYDECMDLYDNNASDIHDEPLQEEDYRNLLENYPAYFQFVKPVYHYTPKLKGLYSILRTRKIWLSNFVKTNDTSEGKIVQKFLLDDICKELITYGISSNDISMLRECFILDVSLFPRYIACFSLKRDLLSQWIHYANYGSGYSIGFKFGQHLFTSASLTFGPNVNGNIKFAAYRMRYVGMDEYAFKEEARKIALTLLEMAKEENLKTIAVLDRNLINLTARLKHSGFKEEQEMRISATPKNAVCDDTKGPRLSHENLAINIIQNERTKQIMEFPFSCNDVTEVMLGPANEKDPKRLESEINEMGYKNVKVTKSLIPYRDPR